MKLPLQNFAALVGAAAAAVQGTARQLVDLTTGSTLRAMLEASASVGLWMQWLIVQVLKMTRAATSEGADLDSWMADFTVTRLPAVAARGTVTFARFVATGAALVPAGTLVRTADGTQSFAVEADPGAAGFDAAQNGWVLAAGTAALDVPVTAVAAGAAGNVRAGSVTLIAAALPGIDTVANAADFAGGRDAEDDAALRARFGAFLASRARATGLAIGYAIASVQQGLQHTLLENVLPDGTPRQGHFVVTVDDGSGAPSASLIAAAAAAVETMRPVGATCTVQAPAVTLADVSMSVTAAAGTPAGAVADAVGSALRAYLEALPLGAPLAASRLVQVAYDASPAVANVSGVLVNGAAADLAVPATGVIRPGVIAVN